MPWFEIEGRSVYESLREPVFHVLIFSDDSVEIPPLPDRLGKDWHDRIDFNYFELNDDVRDRFGTGEPFFVILRPDNYIGMISDEFDPEAVEAYLQKFS